jgi:LPS export ABC transporter protein LptC
MNSAFKTAWIYGLTLAAIGGGGVYVGSRWFAPRPPVSAPAPKPIADDGLPPLQIDDVNFRVSEKGKPQWQFSAQTVQQLNNGRASLNGLKQGIYYKEGKPYLNVKAGGATYDRVSRLMRMNGGVEATGPDGLRFTAPTLTWNGGSQIIVCMGPVQFQTSEGWVTGSKLVADLKKQTFSLQQVAGELKLDPRKKGAPL